MARAGVTNSPLRCMIMLIWSLIWKSPICLLIISLHAIPLWQTFDWISFQPRVNTRPPKTIILLFFSPPNFSSLLQSGMLCCGLILISPFPKCCISSVNAWDRSALEISVSGCCGHNQSGVIMQYLLLETSKICIKICFSVSKVSHSFNNRTSCTIIGCHFFAP